MNYRSDIDGLRAVAVFSVILFHSELSLFSGGYIGVDVFFVISGYLITSLIHDEIKQGTFTFSNFYKRRALRLLPALNITLFVALMFGVIFYDNIALDILGKEIFFSAIGAANILFAQGIDYFVKNEAYQPLIHLWSLGVEEQFYIVWPFILIFLVKYLTRLTTLIPLCLLILSLILSQIATTSGKPSSYFLPQFRAFELLFGVLVSLCLPQINAISEKLTKPLQHLISVTAIAMILIPMMTLNESSNFPGINALWPCLGTALLIAFPDNGIISRTLSNRTMVMMGLISYPLYLYHQPVLSFIHFFELALSPIQMFFVVISICVPLSWVTYKYIEKPIRQKSKTPTPNKQGRTALKLAFFLPVFAVSGLAIAKSNGFEQRFQYLNPFAIEITKAHASTFHTNFNRGFNVKTEGNGDILFIGDSVLQHYVVPMSNALGISLSNVDTVTKGGCVLLQGVDFKEKFSDISCNGLREQLYHLNKHYKYVVISQSWNSYDDRVLNFNPELKLPQKWQPFIDQTISHFSHISENIILIGWHPFVQGTASIQPSIRLDQSQYSNNLKNLEIENTNDMISSEEFFNSMQKYPNIQVINPKDIFCNSRCKIHDDTWSYFGDRQHLTQSSTQFISQQLSRLLDLKEPQ
ncbi:acyltransferase [Paraneptunicella aestuarii]|uniref:acyltransferase family protein n=1 Tax=Paraneptunicella aestuarii TaxID=2831148 RepID=UPI001E5DDDC2|nr:acyltransferase family protein [Paraneptunicella aestuarii]UAA39682.1 acyltransferase [Paraneptunicella aestuarii]